MIHIAQRPVEMGILGGLAFGVRLGALENADLTGLAAAKTAVAADITKRHVSQHALTLPINASLDAVDRYQPGFTSGGNVNAHANLYNGKDVDYVYLNL